MLALTCFLCLFYVLSFYLLTVCLSSCYWRFVAIYLVVFNISISFTTSYLPSLSSLVRIYHVRVYCVENEGRRLRFETSIRPSSEAAGATLPIIRGSHQPPTHCNRISDDEESKACFTAQRVFRVRHKVVQLFRSRRFGRVTGGATLQQSRRNIVSKHKGAVHIEYGTRSNNHLARLNCFCENYV